ncbi:MAG: transposase [Candidatus Omnitrophota bacterium]
MPYRKCNRIPKYDYSRNGYYFVTICTKHRQEWFGNIQNDIMELNEYGQIVRKQWVWLLEQYNYVKLDKFTIMPNHMHGILIISGDARDVGTGRDLSLQKTKSLSGLIGAFKTTSSKLIHMAGLKGFHWQRSFYDRVIRNEKELTQICEYIINNPKQWDMDINNKHENINIVGAGRDLPLLNKII